MEENIEQPIEEAVEAIVPETSCAKCEEYLSGWKRAQADYANLKRETDREKTMFTAYAQERLLGDLLPAIDQFESALNFTPSTDTLAPEEKKKFDNWFAGARAVRGTWESAFRDIGLERVATEGLFDPNLHEAVGEKVDESKPAHAVTQVLQSGWMLKGKLLRPAKVMTNPESQK